MQRYKDWQRTSLIALAAGVSAVAGSAASDALIQRKLTPQDFARPASVPVPVDNPGSADEIALGAALFVDTRLSRNGSKACISCHDPARGFVDGESRGKGIAGVTLKRNTPTLINLAWGESFFWDGRAKTLEEQARGPIENPLEMDMPLAKAVENLKADPRTVETFKRVFGTEGVTEANTLKALAAYERTIVSPKTRFDRWVEGDAEALTPFEIKGYELFAGRAGCAKCHSGWRFTDEAYHDIGLPSTPDTGRSAISGLPHTDHAFKTPTLRELAWTGPYMHDGSMASIEAANDHYFGGIENLRTSLSKDLQVLVPVFAEQRHQITAFLKTLSSEKQPQPVSLPPHVVETVPPVPVATNEVHEKGKQFTPGVIRLRKGDVLTVVNDDDRAHAVLVDDQRYKFSDGVQEPGQNVSLTFPQAGTYAVGSSIHPGMKLTVEVTD